MARICERVQGVLSGFQLQASGKLLTCMANQSAFVMLEIYDQDMLNVSDFILVWGSIFMDKIVERKTYSWGEYKMIIKQLYP